MVLAIDDADCMNILRLFNEDTGREYLKKKGAPVDTVDKLDLLGISGIGNLLSAIKFAKYYELDEDDVVVTILTDSMELYGSRIEEMRDELGVFTPEDAAKIKYSCLDNQKIDNALELNYYDRLRIHNLKYYTWIEQQGRNLDELNAQWYDRAYWKNIQKQTPEIDGLINEFNKEVGLI